MKKALSVFLLFGAFISVTGIAQAASTMIFDPSEYPEVPTVPAKATTVKTTTQTPKETNGIKNLFSTKDKEQEISPELTQKETDNFQNALLQLDSAQVDIRNTLLDKKTQYAEIDSNYKTIKEERASLKKEVRSYEKRVKSIEKAKEKIRKSMI